MKTSFNKIACMAALLAAFSSCTEDMEYKDIQVSTVSQFYEPADGKSAVLQSSSTASLYFEWESAKAEDSGAPLYEVVFDKENGDFSNPIYKVLSDNNGMRNYATISHKVLNKIGAAAGLGSGETGTVKWAVVASRGLNSTLSSVSSKLSITRLEGFAEIPAQLFLTGTATEGGENLAAAVPCTSPEQGVFEVFTRLEGGKTYKLVDGRTDDAATFHVAQNKLVEGDGETTVDQSGVYRILFDFTVATVSVREIASMGLWFCPSNDVTIDLPYAGNGVFSGEGVITFKQESWGRDQRYKFLMEYADGSKQYWGTKNGTDSNPGAAAADDPYFYIMETGDNQWDDKWKFNDEFDGSNTRISVIFNGDNYTHKVELAGASAN